MIDDLLPLLSNKQPKIVATTLAALTAIYHAYGVKVADPKPVIKVLPRIFGHADKNVRSEASNLVVELHRWLREGIKALFWNDLKAVQQQDLDKLFEGADQQPPKQIRLLRSQQAVAAAINDDSNTKWDGPDAEDEPVVVDAFDLAEPVEIASKIPKDLFENLASSKWKDRKEALDSLYTVMSVNRIQEGPFDEIISVLAKCMKDANIAVVAVAANCIETLARGLRKGFAKYRGRVMTPVLERLKEKKQSVADALGTTLDAIFVSTSLSDCLEEVLEFLQHKNPQIKLETLRFLIRCLKNTNEAPSKSETKAIADAATKLLTESTEVTRSGGAEILGTLSKIMGESLMIPFLEKLDEIRRTKVKEYFNVAVVKAKVKPKPVAPPSTAVPANQRKGVGKKVPTGVKKAPTEAFSLQEEGSAPGSMVRQPISRAMLPKQPSNPKTISTAPSSLSRLNKRLPTPGDVTALSISSPKRSPPTITNDEESLPKSKAVPGGRGLAGRPLGKPSSAPLEPSVPDLSPSMSMIERAKLEEMQIDKEQTWKTIECLREEKAQLTLQLNELQNQNAQLIEDHTHDVLSIKAKETQLVRARSDAQAAEQTVLRQTREIERLKRELSRAFRATSPPLADTNDEIYRDLGTNGSPNHVMIGTDGQYANRASREETSRRARGYMISPSQEKENSDRELAQKGKMSSPSNRDSGDLSDSGQSRGGSPRRRGQVTNEGRELGGTEEPIESWRRAAEVTRQLKARIELMKVWPLTSITCSHKCRT